MCRPLALELGAGTVGGQVCRPLALELGAVTVGGQKWTGRGVVRGRRFVGVVIQHGCVLDVPRYNVLIFELFSNQ